MGETHGAFVYGMSKKCYGLVYRKGKWHKRNYNREIKNGLTAYAAEYKSCYSNFDVTFSDLF